MNKTLPLSMLLLLLGSVSTQAQAQQPPYNPGLSTEAFSQQLQSQIQRNIEQDQLMQRFRLELQQEQLRQRLDQQSYDFSYRNSRSGSLLDPGCSLLYNDC